jgi:hypothetical protein
LFFVFSSSLLLNSFDPVVTAPHWQLNSSEFWGVKPIANAPYEQFGQFPFNITYTFGYGIYTYSGQEFNVIRSDRSTLNTVINTTNFTWSQLPSTIYPDTEFNVTYDCEGFKGGIGVSVPVYYKDSYVWKPFIYNGGGGPVTATLKTTKPDADPNHQKMKIGFDMVSGQSFHMEWSYVYNWIP